MGKLIVVPVGTKFGRWTVVERAAKPDSRKDSSERVWFLCRCECGTERVVASITLRDGRSRSCGCLKSELNQARTMENGTNWRGGRSVDDSGYVLLYQPEHHRAKTNGYVREHIVVMESHLGRRLLPHETVHHKNGERANNAIGNLELRCSLHPSGQTIPDLVAWAKEILNTYGEDVDTLCGASS